MIAQDDVQTYDDVHLTGGLMIIHEIVVLGPEVGRMMLYNGGRYGDAGFGIAVLEQE